MCVCLFVCESVSVYMDVYMHIEFFSPESSKIAVVQLNS